MQQVCARLSTNKRKKGLREAKKNPYKGEKRKTGWGDSFRREKEEEGEGGAEEKGKKDRTRGRKRGARREFARFIPPPVFKLRPDVFPSPASLSALRFLLNRWYHRLCRHLAIKPSKQ